MTFNFDRQAYLNMKKFAADENLRTFYTNVFSFSLLSLAEKRKKRNEYFKRLREGEKK